MSATLLNIYVFPDIVLKTAKCNAFLKLVKQFKILCSIKFSNLMLLFWDLLIVLGSQISARLLPEKLTIYTTLVGLLNARNYNFGGEFVEAMIRQLKESLKANNYNEAVYLVSFLFFWLLGSFLVCCDLVLG